jgi:hypothetical protein
MKQNGTTGIAQTLSRTADAIIKHTIMTPRGGSVWELRTPKSKAAHEFLLLMVIHGQAQQELGVSSIHTNAI